MMFKRHTKLKTVFANPITAGIFSSLQALPVPWQAENIACNLDLMFISENGQKIVSPLVETVLDENDKLTTAKQNLLASTIYYMHAKQWAKLYALLSAEYNPIENYSMTESHSGSDTRTETPTEWKETETQTPTEWKSTETQTPTEWKETETQTPTEWKNEKVSLKANNDIDTDTSLYAFNSSSAVPITESSTSTDAKTTEEQTGTFQTDREQTGTFQTETEQTGTFQTERERTGTYEDKTEYNTTLTRSGNIGVTTSQQMIESEIELWKWNFFRDVVFKDVADSLTIAVY